MPAIMENIKSGQFKNLYLIYGEEDYLRNYYRHLLTDALVEKDDNLNYSYFEGASTDINTVAEMIETLPFMAPHRVVVCENTGWMNKTKNSSDSDSEKSSGKLEILIDRLTDISEDVIFILVEENPDKRSKLFKLISSKGIAEEYKTPTEDYLVRWIAGYADKNGKKIRESTARYIISEVGTGMNTLNLEMNKLCSYALDREEITKGDVDEICTHQITGKIFDMITAVSQHNQKEALALYYDLLTLRESPFAILSLLVRQYNLLLQVRDCMERNYSTALMASKIGLQDWLIKKHVSTAKNMTLSELKTALKACAGADEDIKSGNITDTLSIELLLISLSQKK